MGYSSKDINFYIAYKNSRVKKKSGSKKALWILPPVLIILCLGGLFTYFHLQNMEIQKKIDNIDIYITDPEVVVQNEELIKLKEEQTRLLKQRNDFTGIWEAIESYPSLKKELYRSIEICAKNKIIIYDSTYSNQNGTLTMKASSGDVTSAATFIQDINRTGYFKSVSYGGWNLVNDNQYSFTVTCVLLAPEIQEEG